ncbi:MAG: hypothetical protein V7693_08560 [Halopseudomonas sabulinigri]
MNDVLPALRKVLSSNAPTIISEKVTDALTGGRMVCVLVLGVDYYGPIKRFIKNVGAAEVSQAMRQQKHWPQSRGF